uniref:Choline/carnitine acyltransferase domain-containing protein n=1 Tax=Guillardia theta (strain CCMP2712) TaxID=905079 RepID=A0A0C3TEV1_GUITC
MSHLYSHNHLQLPKLPVPDLKSTVQRYLQSLIPLMEPSEFQKYSEIVRKFEEEEGSTLQSLLLQSLEHEGYPYSYVERYWDDMYLNLRCPIPVHVNPAYNLKHDEDCGKPKSQASRLSKFISLSFRWQEKVLRGHLEPEKSPSCMSFFSRLLGTARIPHIGRDILKTNAHSRHVVLIRGNKFFQVQVLSADRSEILSCEALEQQIQHVLDTVPPAKGNEVGVGIFTWEDRDAWANTRKQLETCSAINQESLRTIDSALFVVCLDHGPHQGYTERAQDILHGQMNSISNRWFDKLQIISDSTGALGVNFEHSFSDGVVWNRWLSEVWDNMQGNQALGAPAPLPRFSETNCVDPSCPVALQFEIDSAMENRMREARKRAEALTLNTHTHMLRFSSFGKEKFKLWGLSPDGVVQMAIQIAYHRLHGRAVPTYESCSTKGYFHGRTEMVRAMNQDKRNVSPGYQPFTRNQQTELFKNAVKRQNDLSRLAVQGQGVDRHLMALNKVAHGVLPVDNKLRTARRRCPVTMSFLSNVSTTWNSIFAFGPVSEHGYGVGYLIHDDQVLLNLTSWRDSKVS